MPFLSIVFLPALAFFFFIFLLIKKKYTGLLPVAVYFVFSAALGTWAIFAGKDALGFIILPFFVTAGSFGIWLFTNFRKAPALAPRVFAWLGVCGSVVVIGLFLHNGITQNERQKDIAAQQKIFAAEKFKKRAELLEKISIYKGDKADLLQNEINQNMNDPMYIGVILSFPEVPAAALEKLYDTMQGNEIMLLRHPNVTPALVKKIYEKAIWKPSLYGDLASNKHSSSEILEEVFIEKEKIFGPTGLNNFFAKNPATPYHLLKKISETDRADILLALLENPNCDCALIQKIKTRGASSEVMALAVRKEETLCTPAAKDRPDQPSP